MPKMNKALAYLTLGFLGVLFAGLQAEAKMWITLSPDPLNQDPLQNADFSSAAFANGTLYVAFSEYSPVYSQNQVVVRRWNGSGWETLGSVLNLDPTKAATYPSLAFNGPTPYVAWQDAAYGNNRIFVRFWDGSAWQPLGNSATAVNMAPEAEANQPQLRVYSNRPYVIWSEAVGAQNDEFMKFWNGTAWEQVGSTSLDESAYSAVSGRFDFNGAVPMAAWSQAEGVVRIYAKVFNGTAWEAMGGALNADTSQHAEHPFLAVAGSTPYLIWREYRPAPYRGLYVRTWSGSAWSGAAMINYRNEGHVQAPVLACNGATPYAAWQEGYYSGNDNYRVYVKHFNGASWVLDNGPTDELNLSTAHEATSPSITLNNDCPYVAWTENDGVSKIYVKYYVTETPTGTSTATPTLTETPTASPTASATPSWTPTFTRTPTGTPSCTATPSATRTPTWTATGTFTPTSTRTSTATPSATSTRTPTATSTPTSTPTATRTPTGTPSMTSTRTPTATPTRTSSPTMTRTPTFTSTWTRTPTSTVSPTKTVSVTQSMTATVTPTLTVSATRTASPTSTPTLTVSVTQSVTATLTPTLTPSVTQSMTSTLTPRVPSERHRVLPNPFAPFRGEWARFYIPGGSFNQIRLYTIKGRLVRTVTGEPAWDGKDDAGRECEGGIYLYQLEAEGKRITGTVVLIR